MALVNLSLIGIVNLIIVLTSTEARILGVYNDSVWESMHMMLYGDKNMLGKIGSACKYNNLYNQGYDVNTTTLFNNRLCCRVCFEIKCVNDPSWSHLVGSSEREANARMFGQTDLVKGRLVVAVTP
ncbi:expansin-A6-like [Glycine soja]|uniref:expansin-A6-like n=1 Tax=Glycine soja TaxID=3848 RepID=UPI00103C477A|nr:expansin-A6-like [Glycine soja]